MVERVVRSVRAWDFAASEADGACFTCGVKMSAIKNELTGSERYLVDHMVHGKWSPAKREQVFVEVAKADGVGVTVWMEMEPGSASLAVLHTYAKLLPGYAVRGYNPRPDGSKEVRAEPLAAAFENGLITLARGDWNGTFIDELKSFPLGPTKDIVDAASMAYNRLTRGTVSVEVQGGLLCSGIDVGSGIESDEADEFGRISSGELSSFSPGLRKVLEGFVDDGGYDHLFRE